MCGSQKRITVWVVSVDAAAEETLTTKRSKRKSRFEPYEPFVRFHSSFAEPQISFDDERSAESNNDSIWPLRRNRYLQLRFCCLVSSSEGLKIDTFCICRDREKRSDDNPFT